MVRRARGVIAQRLLPSWVEADSLRSRAVDALGLQRTADRIADRLLPGLSVLTTRARYYTLLAWARRSCGDAVDERKIHQLEVALALREAQLSREEEGHAKACRFIGSRKLAGMGDHAAALRNPRLAYKVPAWRAYRASMENLGLLDSSSELTDLGCKAATAFARKTGADASGRTVLRPRACLSRCSRREGELLRGALGIGARGRLGDDDLDTTRRAALYREIERYFDDGFDASTVLTNFEARRDKAPSSTVGALREAAIWERLSLGLNAVFLLWAHAFDTRRPRPVLQALGAARRSRAADVGLETIEIGVDAGGVARRSLASIRRGLALRARLPSGALVNDDLEIVGLAEAVVGSAPLPQVLRRLEERHLEVKGDEAWLRPRGSSMELARDPGEPWELPTRAGLHPYRLSAFGQIILDLRRARS